MASPIIKPPFGPEIVSCSGAKKYLSQEEDNWSKTFSDEISDPGNAHPVFSFWLLDTQAFGKTDEDFVRTWEDGKWTGWDFEKGMEPDVKKHWPQLGVFHLTPE
ncbi:hypothetical protein N656DRAFT_780495 [Canariomyces notabilis]|uniref:Uncharacterized protein n=1 Tax=Canariomyces notabilis TaxID=2074819 RepID=A0AAN6YRK7_9PEZI|nr:hypothetical protein N656DRAFT_780495 [Canariomyces arenarius]